MNIKRVLIGLLIIMAVVVSVSAASAMDIHDIKFNVSSELKPAEGVGIQFEDDNGNSLIITEEEVGDLGANYTKINETVYLYNYTIAGDTINDADGKELGKMIDVHNFNYGEYIKIDGKTYLVHTSGKPTDPDYDKCLEYLTYFNEHNTLETVKIF